MATQILTTQEQGFDSAGVGTGRWEPINLGNDPSTMALTDSADLAFDGTRSMRIAVTTATPTAGAMLILDDPSEVVPGSELSVGVVVRRDATSASARARCEVYFYEPDSTPISSVIGAWQTNVTETTWRFRSAGGEIPPSCGAIIVAVRFERADGISSFAMGSDLYVDGADVFLYDFTEDTSGEPADTFYALQGWGNGNDAYLCEWKIEDDTPVHVRHVRLPEGDDFTWIIPSTTWITTTHVHVIGYGDGAAGAFCYKVDRTNLTYEWIATNEVDTSSGEPGGYTSTPGGTVLMWDAYANEGPTLRHVNADSFPGPWASTTVIDFAENPGFPVSQFTFGDLLADGDNLIWGAYSKAYVRRSALSDATSSTELFDLRSPWEPVILLDEDFEDLGVGGWSNISGCVLSNVATPSPTPSGGTRVLRVACAAGGGFIQSDLFDIADPRTRLELDLAYRVASGVKSLVVHVDYYDSAGVFLGRRGSSSDTSNTGWETFTFSQFQGSVPGAAKCRWVISVPTFDTTLYFDYTRGHPMNNPGEARFAQEPIKVRRSEDVGFASIEATYGFYPGQHPSMPAQFHYTAAIRFDLATGDILDWWPVDLSPGVPQTLEDHDAFTTGLVLTPGDGHVVAAHENWDQHQDSEGLIWCRNLETGVEGWATTPHPGFNLGPTFSSLLHVGAFHTFAAVRGIVAVGGSLSRIRRHNSRVVRSLA